MSLLLPIKQRITWSLFENDTTWRFWKGNWILRVHMYLLSWRKTNFLCITSILSPKSMSKLINVNCLHFIGCQNYISVDIWHFCWCRSFCHRTESDLFLFLFRSYSELLSKFGDISFQEYVFKGISHPVFYGDLVYKLRRVKDTPNFISSGSKIVKRLRRRHYDPLLIETTIGLVLGPCTALCILFLKHCTLTNKAVGTIWRALSKPPQRRQGPDLRPLWLLVGTPSAIRPEFAFSRAEHSLPYSDVTIYWNKKV